MPSLVFHFLLLLVQKQPPEVLYKTRCSEKFHKIHRKTPVPKFIKKETLAQVFSCEFCEISKNIFFTEHLRATASVSSLYVFCLKHSPLLIWDIIQLPGAYCERLFVVALLIASNYWLFYLSKSLTKISCAKAKWVTLINCTVSLTKALSFN